MVSSKAVVFPRQPCML